MSFRIETVAATGSHPYAVLHNDSTGQVWNTTLNAGAGGWEAYNSAHWAQYAVPMVEQAGSGYFSAAYPAAITGVMTTEVLYDNATPTLGDAPMGIGQSQGSNVAAVAGDQPAAVTFQQSLESMTTGAVVSGTLTPNAFTTNLVDPSLNAYIGLSIRFASGALKGQGVTILAFNPATGLITTTAAFTAAPAASDTFVIA